MITYEDAIKRTVEMPTETASLRMVPRADVDILISELFDQQDQLQQHIKSLEDQLNKSKHLSEQLLIENDLCQNKIKSLEAQLANAEHRKNPKIIRKGQTFHDERNGQVTFLGIDSYCGELSAILVCSDGRTKYPLLANMPEFNFIDN